MSLPNSGSQVSFNPSIQGMEAFYLGNGVHQALTKLPKLKIGEEEKFLLSLAYRFCKKGKRTIFAR